MMKDTRWPEIPLLALRGVQLLLGLLCLSMAGNLIDTYSARSFWEFNIVLVCGLFSMLYAAINFGLFYINLLLPLAIVITDAFLVVLWLVAVAGLGDFESRNGIFDENCSAYASSRLRNTCNVIKAAWVFAFFSFLVFCATTALASYVLHKNRKDLRGAKYNSGMDPNGNEMENGQAVAQVQDRLSQ
ncbi:hypothetical protein P167DRAFT_393238 [Morchella conica CCBAS932]|uniref:MARVEL domain-containing protein n=1 Tax=Morchella conica CCBAS932 TaxID=1392247 RepID=A0A3N4KB55_9PEZI|nr:hypothetical protein P167DRAFT_393238 [Morchella conica CCBAS932]